MFSKNARHYSRPPLRVLVPILFIVAFSTAAFATSVSVAPVTYQNVQGVQFNVTGAFSASSNGFFVSPSAGTASSQPCSWSNGGICQTALVAGDWYYSITLTLNSVPSVTTTYTVTVDWNTGSGYSQLGQLTVSVPTTASAGQTMQFFFNTGLSTFTAPTGIVVTVT
jgi:hypothetical protein